MSRSLKLRLVLQLLTSTVVEAYESPTHVDVAAAAVVVLSVAAVVATRAVDTAVAVALVSRELIQKQKWKQRAGETDAAAATYMWSPKDVAVGKSRFRLGPCVAW